MADFLNTPTTPEPTEANAKAVQLQATGAGSEPRLDYDDATDLGLDAEARAASTARAQAVPASYYESLKAGAKASVLHSLVNKLDAPDFTPDNNFDAGHYLPTDPRTKEMLPDEDELLYLQQANSMDDYQYRWSQIPQVRRDTATASDNPLVGAIGTLGADAPSMLLPLVGEGSIGRTAATALRILGDTYDVASSVYTADQLGQSPLASAMVAGTGILDMTHLISRGMGRVALRGSEDSIDAAADAVQADASAAGTKGAHSADPSSQHLDDTGVTVAPTGTKTADADTPVVDPDQPVMPTPTRDLDDDLSTVDNSSATAAVDDGIQATSQTARNYSTEPVDYTQILNASTKKGNRVSKDNAVIADLGTLRELAPAIVAKVRAMDNTAGLPEYYTDLIQHLGNIESEAKVLIDASPNKRGRFSYYTDRATADDNIRLPTPAGSKRAKVKTAQDIIDRMDVRNLRTLLHESVHSVTSKAISRIESNAEGVTDSMRQTHKDMEALRQHLLKGFKESEHSPEDAKHIQYYLQNVHEMVAGLGDDQGGYTKFLQNQRSISGKEPALRKLTKHIMGLLGIKTSARTGFTDVVDQMTDLLGHHEELFGPYAASKAAPEFASETMRTITEPARKAAQEAAASGADPALAAAKAAYGQVKQRFKQFFALRDDIARGSEEHAAFADRLLSDATHVGSRNASAVDIKRLLKSQMDATAGLVEKAISDELIRSGRAGRVQQFFYSKSFVAERKAMEQKLTEYLDYAHGEAREGRVPDAPDADIANVVKAYTDSGWAERWHDHISNINPEAGEAFAKTPYYLPRRYNGDKLRNLMRSRGLENKDVIDVFSQALRDAYPTMDRDLSRQVARTWHQSLTSAQPAQGAMWRRAINGQSNDEFIQMLMDNGVDIEQAQKILDDATFNKQATGSNPNKNLRKRNALDMQKEYLTPNGKYLKLSELVDSDVTKLMQQYNNRMSGRLGLHSAGYGDLKDLANDIDDLRAKLPEDVEGWTNKVNDTVDSIMGYPPRGDTPDALLASGYLSNALMLKNSGLYQLTDLALTAKEFGMYRTVRAMMQSGLFKHAQIELGKDPSLHRRLHNVLNASVQDDMRFRWLHSYAEDNTDLTRSAQWVNIARNLSQSAYTANGMRFIHRAMVNMNSGLVRDSILAALQGSEKDAALLEKFGMRRDLLDQMRKEHAANPEEILSNNLQQHLETVGQRFMDYVVQQNRTGETAHFAEMNPIGRVLIGYQSFAFAGTNKILRRHLDNGDYVGLGMLMAYQFPMMALATYARYGMDGNLDKKGTSDLVSDAVSGMSAIGGASMVMDLFNSRAGGGVSMLGGFNNIISTLQSIQSKGSMSMKDASKLMPLAQEFIPLRMLINNTADDQ